MNVLNNEYNIHFTDFALSDDYGLEGESDEGGDKGEDAVNTEVEPTGVSARRIVKRGHINWITPRLLAALDNAKVTDGMAVHILIAAAQALNQEVDALILNHTTIRRLRRENRAKLLEDIYGDFIESVI